MECALHANVVVGVTTASSSFLLGGTIHSESAKILVMVLSQPYAKITPQTELMLFAAFLMIIIMMIYWLKPQQQWCSQACRQHGRLLLYLDCLELGHIYVLCIFVRTRDGKKLGKEEVSLKPGKSSP